MPASTACVRHFRGQYPQLADRDDLWRLLVVITTRKVSASARRQFRQKRGGGQVHPACDLAADDAEDDILARAVGSEPTPEFAAMVAEEYRKPLFSLFGDDVLRKVAILRMEGYTTDAIAEVSSTARVLEYPRGNCPYFRSNLGRGCRSGLIAWRMPRFFLVARDATMARLGPHGGSADAPVGREVGFKDQAMDQVFLRKSQCAILRDRMMAGSLSAPSSGSHVELAGGETVTDQRVIGHRLIDRLVEALDSLAVDEREAIEAQFLGEGAGDETTERTVSAFTNAAALVRRGVETLRQRLLGLPEPGGATNAVSLGNDDGRADHVVASYLESLVTSCPLDRGELLSTHPGLAGELSRFFAGYDAAYLWFGALAATARAPRTAETVVTAGGAGERLSLASKVRIGRYELQDVLGGGGQGVVYKALQRGAVEQTVAVKTLRAEGLATEGDVAKFLQEMRMMTELDHPGLVSILDSGIEDGRPFLAMPLMVCRQLDQPPGRDVPSGCGDGRALDGRHRPGSPVPTRQEHGSPRSEAHEYSVRWARPASLRRRFWSGAPRRAGGGTPRSPVGRSLAALHRTWHPSRRPAGSRSWGLKRTFMGWVPSSTRS